jgi:hypothetical protein
MRKIIIFILEIVRGVQTGVDVIQDHRKLIEKRDSLVRSISNPTSDSIMILETLAGN